jgi:hypothetical protein
VTPLQKALCLNDPLPHIRRAIKRRNIHHFGPGDHQRRVGLANGVSEAGWLPRCVAGPCKESRAQGGIICCWPRGAGYSRVGAGAHWRVPLSERSAPRLPLRQPVSGQWPAPAERVSSDQRVPPPAGPGDQSGHVRLQLTEQRSAQYLRLGGASPAGATAMVTVVSASARWGAAAAPGPA